MENIKSHIYGVVLTLHYDVTHRPQKTIPITKLKFACAENCMKKIWANLLSFNYNIEYLRRGQTFMEILTF